MTADELYDDFASGFARRRFSAGLLIAIIDMWKRLGVPGAGMLGLDEVLRRYPAQSKTASGAEANTLIVRTPTGATLSLRPFYNEAERLFRAEHKRFDYPSCAPHATQAWSQYRPWLDVLTSSTSDDLARLRQRVIQYVSDTLVSHEFDPCSVAVEPPLFKRVLESFSLAAQKGEPSGAAYQGVVFGFLRADNPHLQVEIEKVRTGSKRLQRVGDIDAWEGARLAISAEVKQYVLNEKAVADLAAFANATARRGTVGIVVALGFQSAVRTQVEGLGLIALDKDDLLRIVEIWDPLKQRTAVSSLTYYFRHVEKNSSLGDRLDVFLKSETGPPGEGAVLVDESHE